MGGYNSGGHNQKRITAEACVRIDAGMLRRAGLIRAQSLTLLQWSFTRNGNPSCKVNVTARPDTPNSVMFEIVTPNGDRYTQRLPVVFTPCNYGKERAWLSCPLCSRRVFRLFYYGNTWSGDKQVHYFACRYCRGLTYALRRERGLDRYQSQMSKVKDSIKAYLLEHPDPDYPSWVFDEWSAAPVKPKGMRWATFNRLQDKFENAAEGADQATWSFLARFA